MRNKQTERYPLFSIIIPLYIINNRFRKDLEVYKKLNYPNLEIVIVSDREVKLPYRKNIRLFTTNKKRTGPAEKRDLALKYVKGKFCAFIDDDAYPSSNWLRNALIDFQDNRVGAVGGPGVTPSEDNYWEKLTGLVYDSYFCGGEARHRFRSEKIRFVDDFPAYNLIIKTNILKKVGGYGNFFYGGEDTFLCLKIIKAGYRILYDPDVIVYHHRRALFLPYLKQIANVGLHRGYFARVFPETSRKYFYFIPSFLALGFIGGALLSIFNEKIRFIYLLLLSIFIVMGFLSVFRKAGLLKSLIVSFAIIFTHLTYGFSFIKGLLISRLDR